jgi:hypothetical protein
VHGGQQDVDRLSIILGFVGLLGAVVKLHTSRGRESREREKREGGLSKSQVLT